MYSKNLSCKFTIRIPVALKQEFINYCVDQGLTPSDCVRQFMKSVTAAGAHSKEDIRSYEIKRLNFNN